MKPLGEAPVGALDLLRPRRRGPRPGRHRGLSSALSCPRRDPRRNPRDGKCPVKHYGGSDHAERRGRVEHHPGRTAFRAVRPLVRRGPGRRAGWPRRRLSPRRRAKARPRRGMVLLKGADPRGFVFYTNLDSRKGEELAENPRAALCFHWKSLVRQVRIEGAVEIGQRRRGRRLFRHAPARRQIGAWASVQSRRSASAARVRAAAQRGRRALCRRPGAAAAVLVRLSRRAGEHSSFGRSVRSGCMTASSIAAPARHGAASCCFPNRAPAGTSLAAHSPKLGR